MKRTLRYAIIMVLLQLCRGQGALAQAVVQTGKSYINITKGATGGTIEAGDILEIRATIAVGNWSAATGVVTNTYYIDTIPANTTYIANSMKLVSNEGVTVRSFTDAGDLDQGRYIGGILRMNIGSTYNGNVPASVNRGGACNTVSAGGNTGGKIQWNGRPSFFGGVCIISASYRIQVNTGLAYGTLINMAGGAFRYNDGVSNITSYLPAYKAQLTENLGLCSNSIGANAIIDNGGTFGSGNTQNRATSAIVPGYTLTNVTGNTPNDGSYAIVNNLSPTGSTNENEPKPDINAPLTRVFNLWDIMGDHTGSSTGVGNPPTAPGSNGGYFVAINASYANTNAIQQTVSGLCPNTYYEFSAWFKNICEYCACDTSGDPPYRTVSGVSVPNTNFNGTDSSGVNPNLTFSVDGIDLYTTGTMPYTGQWVKKGFVLLTGPGQTSFTLTIRNNAPGGGGNDWALDDVTLATCTPNLLLTPSGGVNVCYGNTVDMNTVVRSFYPNYTQWIWERSTDGGSTWSSTAVTGTGSPSLVGGEWQYTSIYPTFLADSSVHNNMFRIKVATTSSNLADANCSFTASNTIVVLVNNCSWVLQAKLLSFTGTLDGEYGKLAWSASAEDEDLAYEIERSYDGNHFEKIGTMIAFPGTGTHDYNFTDNQPVTDVAYYRLHMKSPKSGAYSKIIVLNRKLYFGVRSLVNPFRQQLAFTLIAPESGTAHITLTDNYGRMVYREERMLYEGWNNIQSGLPASLASGMYTLQVRMGKYLSTNRVIRQ